MGIRPIRWHALLLIIVGASLPASNANDAMPLHQQIDRAFDKRNKSTTPPLANDAEFLRRAFLDLAGTIPTSAQVRRFLADKRPGKRQALIDRLVKLPTFARRMREAFTVMLLERRPGRVIPDERWNAFLEEAFRKNKPWDKLVAEIIAADGLNERTAAGMRFFVDGGRSDPNQMTRDVGRLFLGMDLQCAQCHDHPNVRSYKQSHYFGLFAFLSNSKSRGKFFIATPTAKRLEFQSVFVPDKKNTTGPRLPDGKEVAVPVFKKKNDAIAKPAKIGAPAVPKFRPRKLLAKQLVAASNDRFVRNNVNRIWFLMMGRGLVHPLDLMHADNPASHPDVLKLLAREFVAHEFDVTWLVRELALTRVYQRRSRLPKGVKAADVKPHQYRAAIAKPLSAEQMAWSLLQATGCAKSYSALPKSKDKTFSIKDYVNHRIPPPDNLRDLMTLFAGVYGNPPGEAEVEFSPSTKHALFLMNDRLIAQWLKPGRGNTVERLSKLKDARKFADELYLTVLTRYPNKYEYAEVAGYLKTHSNRAWAAADLVWALMASNEFRLNH